MKSKLFSFIYFFCSFWGRMSKPTTTRYYQVRNQRGSYSLSQTYLFVPIKQDRKAASGLLVAEGYLWVRWRLLPILQVNITSDRYFFVLEDRKGNSGLLLMAQVFIINIGNPFHHYKYYRAGSHNRVSTIHEDKRRFILVLLRSKLHDGKSANFPIEGGLA